MIKRYWTVGVNIGIANAKRTEIIDMCKVLGIEDEELQEMTEEDVRNEAEKEAEYFANECIDIWAAPND